MAGRLFVSTVGQFEAPLRLPHLQYAASQCCAAACWSLPEVSATAQVCCRCCCGSAVSTAMAGYGTCRHGVRDLLAGWFKTGRSWCMGRPSCPTASRRRWRSSTPRASTWSRSASPTATPTTRRTPHRLQVCMTGAQSCEHESGPLTGVQPVRFEWVSAAKYVRWHEHRHQPRSLGARGSQPTTLLQSARADVWPPGPPQSIHSLELRGWHSIIIGRKP